MALAHCKGQAVSLRVITSSAARLSANVIKARGRKASDMDVSHATKTEELIRLAAHVVILPVKYYMSITKVILFLASSGRRPMMV